MGYVAPSSITISLDRERKWQFDMNAMIALHQALGADAFERIERLKPEEGQPAPKLTPESLEVFRALFWCGLVTGDPKLTLEEAGALATPRSLIEALPGILKAMNEGMSDPTVAAAAEPSREQTSGPSPE